MTDSIQIDFVTDYGWPHTHGMAEKGLPELEIRGVPSFLAPAAAALLNDVCDYMLRTGKRVKAGETMSSSGAVFRFVAPEPMPGNEEHYEVERLQIVDVAPPCDCCGHSSSD